MGEMYAYYFPLNKNVHTLVELIYLRLGLLLSVKVYSSLFSKTDNM